MSQGRSDPKLPTRSSQRREGIRRRDVLLSGTSLFAVSTFSALAPVLAQETRPNVGAGAISVSMVALFRRLASTPSQRPDCVSTTTRSRRNAHLRAAPL